MLEYHEFSLLSSNSSEPSLHSFLQKYPNSKYSIQVSNFIAVSQAINLSDEATIYDYQQAINYAKDEITTKIVKSYISANKKKQKQRLNYYKAWERKKNGGLFNIGLDFCDFAYNWKEDEAVLYYNVGLLFRIGNYRDRFQFVLGIKPGIIGYDCNISEYSTNREFKFHMPIIAQLKLNLFNLDEESILYILGQYQYNAVMVKEVESKMAWGVGIGAAWKHIDFSIYYRNDIGKPKGIDPDIQRYGGVSVIYYWQIN